MGVPRPWVLALLLAAVVLAGCADRSGPDPVVPEPDPVGTIAPAAALEIASGYIDVSIRTHRTSEFAVARSPLNPMHVIAAGMDWDGQGGVVQCSAFVTLDGGHRWMAVPALPGHQAGHEDTDPWVAFDDTGRAYLVCAEAGVGLLLGESVDGGLSWEPARVILTGGLAAKPSLGAFGDGELFLCFQQGTLRVLHSTDRGATWTEKSFPPLAGCNGVVRGPDDRISIVYQGGGAIEADRPTPPPPVLGVVSTPDHGATWSLTQVYEDLGTAPINEPGLPQAAAPSLAVSQVTGSIFLAAQRYQNAEVLGPLAASSRADALLWRSRDGAATFEPLELPVAASEECADCHVVHPTLTVDDKGRVVIQYTLSDGLSTRKEVWVSVSPDDGKSWIDPIRVAYTGLQESFLNLGNFVGELGEPAEAVAEIYEHPDQAVSILQSQVTHATWPVTHRDGGEYWGFVTTPEGIVSMWVQHAIEGQNVITARHVHILE